MKHTIMDFKKVPIKVSGLEFVQPPDLSFKVVATLDKKIAKEVSENPLFQQEMQAQAKEILDQTTKMVADKCKTFDKLFAGMISKGADEKALEPHIKGLNKAIKDDMAVAEKAAELGVQKVWSSLQAKRKEWKKFKIKVAASIAGTVAAISLSIAGLLTSPWSGGAGGVLAIAGFIKSGIKMAQDIKKLAIGIDGASKELKGHLAYLETTGQKKGVFVANEVGAAVLNEFIGIAQPSIKSAGDCADTLKAKYAQMIVKMHDLSKTMNKALKEQGKVKKDFLAEASKRLKKHPTKDKAGQLKKISAQLDRVLAANFKKVEEQIVKIQMMYGDTKVWAAKIKALMARLAQLKLKDSKGLKVFREAIKLAAVPLGAIDGNAIADQAVGLGIGLGGSVGGYVYDKIASQAIDGTIFDAA